MSDPSGDGGNEVVQELFAHLSRRPQHSPRSEAVSGARPQDILASPSPSRTTQTPGSTLHPQRASSFSPSTGADLAGMDPSGQDGMARLLGLLNFGGQKESSPSATVEHESAVPGQSPRTQQHTRDATATWLSGEHGRSPSAHHHARGVSAADLVGTSMGRPAGYENITPSPPVEAGTASFSGLNPNPQDQLLQLLNKPQQQQRAGISSRSSLSAEVKSPQIGSGPPEVAPVGASSAVEPIVTNLSTSPANRDSPIRVFGSRESRENTPFEPQDLPTPSSKPTDKGIFTYVNPFDQLASANNKAVDNASINGSSSKSKRKSARTSPAPEPIRKGISQSMEIASPAPLLDGRTRVEALMGIGAPTTDPEVMSQALANVTEQVEKQVAYEATHHQSESPAPKKAKKGASPSQQLVEAAGTEIDRSATEVKREIESEEVRQALEKLTTNDGAEALQDMMDEASAADDEESSGNDDEFQVVPVYNIPLRPFVAIELLQSVHPSLNFRERSITDIARVKKEFDQIDRNLVTASEGYIVYATPKKPFGIRVIQQEDGKDRQFFKENDPIFNVAVSSSPSSKNQQGLETVIATGTSGTVYWSVIRHDGRDRSQDDDIFKNSLVFPPFSGHEGEHTSGGQLKTRAKKSNRHPEFFAIGRGKTIQVIFPFHAMRSNFVKKGSIVDTEGYFKERSIKISTGKAGKDFTFSEDDTVLASLDKAGRLRFWDVRDLVEESNGTASKLASMEVNKPIMTVPTAHVNDKPWPTSVLFVDKIRPYVRGSALRYVIVGMKQNHTLQLWDLSLGKVVQELALPHENESDAICSVAFHPATGIIVVGHPTRNSIYLIHLSAPKYNLQGINQAKYLQAIIQKNPNLPKPESTAIMSGIREYSFASKGHIRSLDLLSSQNSTVDKRPDDERGQFELYVMHSKGVICLNIRKADLGWSHDNKVITKVDGEEEGFIRVRNLQELKPVEISEMSSVNGDAVGSTKGVSSRALSPLPETGSAQERQASTPGEAPVNGTPAAPSSKTEKRKKKRTEHPTEEVFDDIPPPAPVPPAAPFPPTASRNASSSTSKKEPKTPKKEPKDEPPPGLRQLALPSTENMPQTDDTVAEAARRETQRGVKQFTDRDLRPIIQQELKQVETGLKTSVVGAFEAEMGNLRRSIDDDRRAAGAASAGHQEAILRLVSQSLTENVDAVLNDIVAKNVQSKVVPAINQSTEKQLRKTVTDWLNNNLQQSLTSQIKSSVPESIGNAMGSQQLLHSLSEGVTSKISKRLDREMQSTFIPQFQSLVSTAVTESQGRLAEHIKPFEVKAQNDAAKIDRLTLLTEDLVETVRRMAETQSAMRDEMSTLQEEVTRLRASQPPSSGPMALATVEAPVESPEERELNEIVSLINDGRFEEGTIQWLQSPNKETIFLKFFINYDPSYLQQCPSLVILSVGATVIASLEDHVSQRLHWVGAALGYFDPSDGEAKTIAPRIMDYIVQRLESRYMSLAEADSTDPSLKQIPILVQKAKELKSVAALT